MSMLVRVGLAALVSLVVVSNATAQKVKPKNQVKPFSAKENLYFDCAWVNTGGPSGGDSGGGSD